MPRGTARGTTTLLAGSAVLVLALTACTDDADPDVPQFSGSSTSEPSEPVDPSAPSSGTSDPTATSVEVAPAQLPDDQAAVLTGFAGFMDDWMAVAGNPSDPALQTSDFATTDGQAELVSLAGNLLEAGNSIQGAILLDAPAVSITGGLSAGLTACLDQSSTTLVATDGSELENDESPRVAASAGLVRSGDAWLLATLDITGDPC